MPAAIRQSLVSQLLPSLTVTNLQDEAQALAPTVSDADFVRVAYDRLLARAADESGLRHYVAALAAGRYPRERGAGAHPVARVCTAVEPRPARYPAL